MNSNSNRPIGRDDGQRLKEHGMALAANAKPDRLIVGQISMLDALLESPDTTATIDDATADLSSTFGDGGKWRGTVTRALRVLGIIEKAGAVKSRRPSRHCGFVTLWRVRDRPKAIAFRHRLRAILSKPNEIPPAASNSDQLNNKTERQGMLFN